MQPEFDRKSIPRGIRNNNPGNIRHGDKWNGLAKEQQDRSFCTFVAPEYGIRAMAKILLNYQKKYGLNTVRKIINRWAPPNENNTDSYIKHVANQCGVDPDQPYSNIQKHLISLIPAIIRHENGINPYSLDLIRLGIQMAKEA